MAENILITLIVIIFVSLTAVILKQEPKMDGLSAPPQGYGDTYWGRNKGRSKEAVLARCTMLLMWILAGLSFIMVMLDKII